MATLKNSPYAIPRFTKSELDRADLCAKALWYGIAFDTGKPQDSDAYLIERFATQYYAFSKTGAQIPPPIMELEVRELIRVCRIYILYRGIKGISFRNGIKAIENNIHQIYKSFIRRGYKGTPQNDGATCVQALSNGFVNNPKYNRIVLSTRILFFLIPNLMIFNLSTKVAKSMGFKPPTQNYLYQFSDSFYKGLIKNQNRLSKYSLPPDLLNEVTTTTWETVKRTDWWARRVLDIAVLLDTGNTKVAQTNLQNLIDEKIKKKYVFQRKTQHRLVKN